MSTTEQLDRALEHLDDLLNVPRQVWFLGAGVSKDAGVPLMHDLTHRVESLLDSPDALAPIDTSRSATLYKNINSQLHDSAHVEHMLSQIGDLISLADRKDDPIVYIGEDSVSASELREAHHHIQLAIRYTIEYGYRAASEQQDEQTGTPTSPIVQRKYHDRFITSLFQHRRAGLEQNPPVRFITTNYDTLLEDALAHAHIAYVDGFSGGATAFWDPRNMDNRLQEAIRLNRHTASICKLHGSIDWVADHTDVVMRVRPTAIQTHVTNDHRLLIYPQANKYQVTQRDPFASLFAEFRSALSSRAPTVLIACGYSFRDDHVNEEIERALKFGPSTLTVLALCHQSVNGSGELCANQGLPETVANWLTTPAYAERVVVAGSRGYYHGSLDNRIDATEERNWWTFSGLSKILTHGPESSP